MSKLAIETAVPITAIAFPQCPYDSHDHTCPNENNFEPNFALQLCGKSAEYDKLHGAMKNINISRLFFAVYTRRLEHISQIAMDYCLRQVESACKINIAYDKQCAPVTLDSDGVFNFGVDTNADQAIDADLKARGHDGRTDCRVHYSASSLTMRIL